jgi:minor fimbrial subunit
MRNNIKILKNVLMLGIVASISLSSGVRADTQLNIKGMIKASPCVVDNSGGSGISVSLGDKIKAYTLADASSSSGWVEFKIDLKDCPTTATLAIATFGGTESKESAALYQNLGEATNVQIELQSQAGANLGNGKTMSQPVNPDNHTVTFPLQARVYSFAGGATPGSIIGTVLVDLTYE